jgi:hypothetical protein
MKNARFHTQYFSAQARGTTAIDIDLFTDEF